MSTPKKEFVMTQVFDNAQKIYWPNGAGSQVEHHFNATWRILVFNLKQNLHLQILCVERKSADDVQGDVEFKLESPRGRSLTVCREMIWGGMEWAKVIDWNTFLEHYVVDGRVTISARVRIDKMIGFGKEDLRKFDESVKDCSDLVLVVSGRRFYVSKMFLAFQSSHFKSQFLESSETAEIELDDVDPDDFQNFLELLHGESSLDDFTLEGILNLAVAYDAPTALHRCEDFLREKSEKSLGNKLELSSIYGLEKLKKMYLSAIRTPEYLKTIINGNVENFNAPILKDLLRKSIAIFRPEFENQSLNILAAILKFLWKFIGLPRKRLRNFDDNGCSDVVIVVGGQKFYSSKMFLAMQSAFFKSLLLGSFAESEQAEVKLDEIDPNDFQFFLELLHGEPSINDATVEGILKLADMYDSPTALRRCEQFLKDESKISVGKKLELASRFNLEDLKKKSLSEVTTFIDLYDIVQYNMEQLDESILRALLRKSIEFS